MATNEELVGFVKEGLGRGLSRQEIANVLLRAGWNPEQVKNAMAQFAEIEFPIPVPKPTPYVSAYETFIYLVLFSTLYLSAYNIGDLLFQFINRAFPDPVDPAYSEYARASMRWSLSAVIVAFPTFLYVSWLTSRAVARDPTKRASTVRRWLTYLTLFIAAGVLVGDFITLLYNFLGGELTVRFLLKVLVVAAIAGATFGYYLWDVRAAEKELNG